MPDDHDSKQVSSLQGEELIKAMEEWADRREAMAEDRTKLANHRTDLALEAIRTVPYDLVITDRQMEQVSGMDILKEVNRLYPHTRVIMLTAYATLDATIEAIRERIYDFFPKPVKIEELKQSVKKALGD